MKEIEIIPLAKKKIEKRGISEAWVSEALQMRIKSSKDTAVVRLRNSAAEFAAVRSFFGWFSKRPRINTWGSPRT